jgi:hypothetical protein
VQKPDRIGQIAEHPKYLLPELRRIGFRTMIQWRDGQISLTGAMYKRGDFSLYVLVPARGKGGMVITWQGSGSQGVRILDRAWTLHIHEVIAYTNGGLYLIESLSS